MNLEYLSRLMRRTVWTLEWMLNKELNPFVNQLEIDDGALSVFSKVQSPMYVMNNTEQALMEFSLREKPKEIQIDSPYLSHELKEQLTKIFYALDNL
mmetsp:Transcript_37533/g.27676  ORF Transcript_37533/g.27676 Transcript_37533/m.27676 type:complete len:97 (+) Transcript_37533:605-895(+)